MIKNKEEQEADDKLQMIPIEQQIVRQEIQQKIQAQRTWRNMRILWHSVAPYINCYDDQTEILTENGWKLFKDLVNERVMTYNRKTGFLEWQFPTQKIIADYSGLMYHMRTRQIDLLVTPNHRMLVGKRQKDNSWKYREAPALTLKGLRVRYLKAGKWEGKDTLEGFQRGSLEDWTQFLGYYLAEGHIDHNPFNGNYTICLTQVGRLREKMKEAFQRITQSKVFDAQHHICARDKGLWFYLRELGYAHEKYIPKGVKELSPKYLGILLKAYREGDGSKNQPLLFTTSPKLRDDLQEIAIKTEHGSNWGLHSKKGHLGLFGAAKFDCFHISLVSPEAGVNKEKAWDKVVEYNGKVYCVTVPNSWIVVRRNGKAVISGNSGYGTVTRYFMSGLLNRGFTGFVSAYYGLQPGGIINWKGIYVLPVQKTQSDQLGFLSSIEHYKRFQCDLGIFHADFWVSYPFAKKIPYTLCYCYDKETEILTSTGWKYLKDLTGREKVATLKNNRLEYQIPTEIVTFDYKAKMYKFKNRNIDLLVTPNHLLFCKKTGSLGTSSRWELLRAEDVLGLRKKYKKDHRVFQTKVKENSRRNPKEIRGYETGNFVRLLGWYISEGSTWGDQVIISQSRRANPSFCREIESLFGKMGLSYKYYEGSNQYFFKEPKLAKYLRREIGRTSSSKRIPRRFLDLPNEKLELLYETLRKGDGEKLRNRYSSTSKQLVDNIQELLFKIGKASNIGFSNGLFRLEVLRKGEVWDRHRKLGLGNKTVESLVDYEGKVYCVRVPNQIIYVRREGKPIWCSNSPLDHENYPDKWLEVLRTYKWIATPSKHAQNELAKADIESTFVPHGVNIQSYHPLDKALSRKAFTLDKDKFIIGIVAANNDDECFDLETEILTKNGWKRRSEISGEDLFATLGRNDSLEYQKALRIVDYEGKREMYHLETKYLDLCTTAEHEHYVQAFNSKIPGGRTSFRKETSKQIFGKRRCFKKTAIWKGKEQAFLILPEYRSGWNNSEREIFRPQKKIRMDDFLKLAGYYISEGNSDKYSIFISQKEGAKKEEMKTDLLKLPYEIGTSDGKIFICDSQLASYMKRFGKGAQFKKIPDELKDLSPRQLTILWLALVKGDGWKHYNSESYGTASKRLADDLQEVLLKMGFWGSVKEVKTKTGRIGNRLVTPTSETIFHIRRNKILKNVQKPTSGKLFKEEWIQHSGRVWCIEVPNHLVYVRRNGKANWSGQTRKGWDANFEAVKYFFDANPDAVKDTIIFIHTDPENERGRNLIELSRQIGIEKSIIWNDRYTAALLTLPENVMCKLYNSLDVFLLLSRREGFCMPALEAQACGVPCILNAFSALIERNDNGRCGWLVQPAAKIYSPLNAITSIPDPRKGADAIEEAYNNESKRKMFAKKSLAYAKRQTWDIALDKYMLPLLQRIGEEMPALTSRKEPKKIAEG